MVHGFWRALLFCFVGVLAACSGTVNEPCAQATGAAVLRARCGGCHLSTLTGAARQNATLGVDFDTQADEQRWAPRIRQRARVDQTMPPEGPLPACEAALLDEHLKELESGACQPSCSGRACGDDHCGGTCGSCTSGISCDAYTGRCGGSSCSPSCSGKTCGPDGCGGACGTCGVGLACDAQGTCACVPQCSGRACGPDGCGGSCGTCNGMLRCNTNDGRCQATCAPSCSGRVCGDDGCGGSCGPACPAGQGCTSAGQCACIPSCSGKTCGSDGCGGACGTCSSAQTCDAGVCTFSPKGFAADVFPIFQKYGCGSGMGCHAGMRPAENLELATASAAYAGLVGVRSSQCTTNRTRVVKNDVAASYLVNKLTGQGMCLGSVMPKAGSTLTAAELDVVRAWISTGANP